MKNIFHPVRYIAIVAILFFVTLPLAADDKPLDARLQNALKRVDELVKAELAKSKIGGCTVGVVVGPKLVWSKSYGLADIENSVKAGNDHLYRIGSITKQFTGLMLLKLAEDGKVKLSDPVAKYFPEFAHVEGYPKDASPVTLQQLASMTSGLAREPRNTRTYLKGSVAEWETVLLAALKETRFRYEPDTRYFYSNIGYAVLGSTLSRAAKKPYVEYVTNRILKPLGMTDTVFEPNEKINDRIAKGYLPRNGKGEGRIPAREHQGRGYKVPNGAMYTTVGDLAKFLTFELGYGPEEVLPKKTLANNFNRVHSSNANLSRGYGIGFAISRLGNHVIFGHGGGVAGYNAGAYVNRQTNTGVVVLRNVSGGRFVTSSLARKILFEVAQSQPKKKKRKRN